MFKIGDSVIDAQWTGDWGEVMVGTVRGRYRKHYLVRWEKAPKWRRYSHEVEKDLLPVDSPAASLLADIGRRIIGLEDEIERLRAEARGIIKSAGGRQVEQTEDSSQDPRDN